MGKTVGGAIWLDPEMLSAYDFWQYWRNTEDADVSRFLKLYTTMPLEEISRLSALEGAELNDAKKILATEVTAMLHGRSEATKAEETAHNTFEGTGISRDLPTINIQHSELDAELGILGALVTAGLASSNSEARRHIKGGAVKVNDKSWSDERGTIGSEHLSGDGVIKLSVGKKKHILLKAH